MLYQLPSQRRRASQKRATDKKAHRQTAFPAYILRKYLTCVRTLPRSVSIVAVALSYWLFFFFALSSRSHSAFGRRGCEHSPIQPLPQTDASCLLVALFPKALAPCP